MKKEKPKKLTGAQTCINEEKLAEIIASKIHLWVCLPPLRQSKAVGVVKASYFNAATVVLSAEIINKKKNNSVAPNDGETLKVGNRKSPLSHCKPPALPNQIQWSFKWLN